MCLVIAVPALVYCRLAYIPHTQKPPSHPPGSTSTRLDPATLESIAVNAPHICAGAKIPSPFPLPPPPPLPPGSTSTRLDPATLEAIAADAPSTSLPWADVIGRTVADVAAASKLVGSKGAARRLVQQGGMYLNNEKVGGGGSEGERVVGEEDLVGGSMLLLGSGKKNKMIVRVER
ncbi:unnamed protein product [Closterium sp. NIES-53]